MDKKIIEILNNKEIVDKINACESEAAVLEVLKENGIEVSSLEEFKEMANTSIEELDNDELENINGAGICALLGFGNSFSLCFFGGMSEVDGEGDKTMGAGINYCKYVGIGASLIF